MNVYECKCRRQPPLFIIKRKPKENKKFSAKTRAITEVASTKKGIQKKTMISTTSHNPPQNKENKTLSKKKKKN